MHSFGYAEEIQAFAQYQIQIKPTFSGVSPGSVGPGVVTRAGKNVGAGDGIVKLKLGKRPAAEPYIGRELTLGLRPEHCDLLPPAKTGAVNVIDALVDMIEPIGAETYFYLQTGAHTLISRSSARVDNRRSGHRLHFEINAEQAHLFDPDTGMRIV